MVRRSVAMELDDYSKSRKSRASDLCWNARLADRYFSRHMTTLRQCRYQVPVTTAIQIPDRITGQ